MLKKILFQLISIFLAFRSYEILRTLWLLEPAKLNIWMVLLLSLLLNLFITGIFAFIGFAYPTNQLLPDNYYRIRNRSSIATLSRVLKIEYFKKFLLWLFWGKEKNRTKYFDGTKQGLENFDYQTRQSEFGHLAALLLIQGAVMVMLVHGHFLMAVITTSLNFLSNFYPVVLQRNHRARIERMKSIQRTRYGK